MLTGRRRKPRRKCEGIATSTGDGTMSVERLFTATPAETLYQERDSELHGHRQRVSAPESWGQIAVDIVAGKYLRRSGVERGVYAAKTGEHGVPDCLRHATAGAGVPDGAVPRG